MNVNGKHYRTIWEAEGGVEIIDQTLLPHEFKTTVLRSMSDCAHAIRAMLVRGAPLIGATAAYGIVLQCLEDPADGPLEIAYETLRSTRPTAVNLRWALERMKQALVPIEIAERYVRARKAAAAICDEDVAINAAIGRHGLAIFREIQGRKRATLNVLTHCNAGWLACVDWGTALAPIYLAHDSGLPLHVWVDETRPRNQGASLTAWELGRHGVPHTLIVDNAGGHLLQHGLVDVCIVGTDRTTASGDVCNKIGTYLKALAAHDNGVPFYVALPSPTIDWTIQDGLRQIPIEERGAEEVATVSGLTRAGARETVSIVPAGTPVANYGFDVTPAKYVTGLITEKGVCTASEAGLRGLFGTGSDVPPVFGAERLI
jgi:methylthioribose-1-phosphate isomerase